VVQLAFVLLPSASYPTPARVVEEAAKYGVELHATDARDPLTFEIEGGGSFAIMMVAAPHPDVANMVAGPTSPTVEEMRACPAHAMVTAIGLDGSARALDTQMAALTGAVVRSTGAVAAMLSHGMFFHRGDLYADMAALGAEHGELPVEVAIDVSMAPEEGERMSLLTHGMARYGREELFVTCPVNGKGALGFVFDTARWLLSDPPPHLPTGDTIGRSATERLVIQRVPSPIGAPALVMRLDLQS
jgi:hypothetical protein